MIRNVIWETLRASIFEVFPEFSAQNITQDDSLSDLGANSIDRAEIIMLTMARLKHNVPLIEFAQAKNVGQIVDIFSRQLQPVD